MVSEEDNESDDSEENMLYEQRQTIVHNWLKTKSVHSEPEQNDELPSVSPSPTPSPSPLPLSSPSPSRPQEVRGSPPKKALPGLPHPPKRNKPQANPAIPQSKQFNLQEEQQKVLSNPNTIKTLIIEMGGQASFFVQQTTLFVQLNENPTDQIWGQISDIFSKYTGALIPSD